MTHASLLYPLYILSMSQLATTESIQKTAAALADHSFEAIEVASKEEALEKIKELIPTGATVMNGASQTLEQIGYIDYAKSDAHPWVNLHTSIIAEKDPAKQAELRQDAFKADYYLGSAHALTETGEILIASNTGSQLPHLAFTSKNVILVIGVQKIVSDVPAGFTRIANDVIPLEDERMKGVYGYGTLWAKTLVMHRENPALGRSVRVIIVNEELGF